MKNKPMFYGWKMVILAFIIVVIGNVPVYNLASFYMVPIITEFGATHFQFSIAQTLSALLSMGFSVFMSPRIAKGNIRKMMMICGSISAVIYVCLSFVTAIWQVWVLLPIGNFLGMFMALVPMNIMITKWFGEKKALATGLMMTGNGIGGMIWSPIFANIIANQGWRVSWRVMAGCVIFSALFLSPFFKTPAEAGQKPLEAEAKADGQGAKPATPVWQGLTRKQALSTAPLYTYFFASVCSGIIAAAILGQVPAYLIDYGYNYAAVMATYSFVSIFGMIFMGRLIDKVGMKLSTCIGVGMIIIELVCFLLASKSVVFAFVGACFMGIGHAIANLTPTQLTTKVFGSKDYAAIFGIGYMGFNCGGVIGPPLAAGVRTATNSYFGAWYAFIGIAVLLLLFSLYSLNSNKQLREKYPNEPTAHTNVT